jgi:hypothetical protein
MRCTAEGLAERHLSGFRVGGLSVGVVSAREDDVIFGPHLQAFRDEPQVFDIDIRIEWVPNLAPESGREIFHSGATWLVCESEEGLRFDFGDPSFGEGPCKRMRVNSRFCQGTLELSEQSYSAFPWAIPPLDYPVDELLITHRLTQERGIELHGCGIVTTEGTGNLFVGHSGAGKSTTTRLWTAAEDVEILSDDRIIVREHPGHMRMYGTPWHGEAMFASPNSAPLTRIMILEHGHGNVLTRLSRGQAVAELFARSFVPMHRHEYVESALEFLQSVAESVPCYRYSFEPDPRAVEKILHLHD